MGTASGFDWYTLEPFVTSFVRHVKSAELVLFLKDISDFTLDRLKNCGKGALKIEPFEYREMHNIGIDRFENFKRYVDAHGDNYEQIFITDTRDVIFQGDVFDCFKGQYNFLGYSTEADDIRGSKTGDRANYNWITDCFGKNEADKLLDKKIICAGSALIGTPREVKIFLEKLLSNDFPNEKFAFDQAAFNYLIHNNLLPIENLIESDVESGAIFTVALVNKFSVRGGKILRGDGGVPAVVHQYDRHKHLVQLVDETYRDKDFKLDGRFDDTQSVIEQMPYLLQSDRIGEATRLFLKKFLSNEDFSNYNRILIKIWKMLVDKPRSQTAELLGLAVQDAIKSVKSFSIPDLKTICQTLKKAEKIGYPVEFEFKRYIAAFLFYIAEKTFKTNDLKSCLQCLDLIAGIDVVPDKDVYLFAAKANRLAGRKDAALEAYKKVLELG